MYIFVECIFIYSVFFVAGIVSEAPEACFANFRWEDCGKEPVAVMYYWKPGSRCEVGLWRGCLPNINMFRDEYECVSTCIFTARAMPEDYHNVFGVEEPKTIPTLDVTFNEGDNETTTTAIGDESTGATTNAEGSGTGPANKTEPAGAGGGAAPTTVPDNATTNKAS